MIRAGELQPGDLVTLPGPRGLEVEIATIERDTIGMTDVEALWVTYRTTTDGIGAGGETYSRELATLRPLLPDEPVDARRPERYDRPASDAGGGQTRSRSRLADNPPPASSSRASSSGIAADPAGEARARLTDPATSHAAARSVTGLRASQAAILELLRERGPMSDDELVRRYTAAAEERPLPRQSPSGIRTRRHELAEAGEIVAVSETVLETGRKATVWDLASRPLEVYDPEPPL